MITKTEAQRMQDKLNQLEMPEIKLENQERGESHFKSHKMSPAKQAFKAIDSDPKEIESEQRDLNPADEHDQQGIADDDELPTVGTDVMVQHKVPEFTDIKVKSKLDRTQPSRVESSKFSKENLNSAPGLGNGDGGVEERQMSDIGSQSDFGDLEFADVADQ